MERTFLISLMVLTYFSLQAQTNKMTITYQPQPNVGIEYAKNKGNFVTWPDVKTDNKTKKTTVEWHQTNMDLQLFQCVDALYIPKVNSSMSLRRTNGDFHLLSISSTFTAGFLFCR